MIETKVANDSLALRALAGSGATEDEYYLLPLQLWPRLLLFSLISGIDLVHALK